MNRYRYLFENIAVFVAGNVLSKVFSLCMLSLFTRYLKPEEFGDAEVLISTITSVIIPIFTVCISDASMRFLLGEDNPIKVITSAFSVILSGSILLLLFLPIAYQFEIITNYYHYIILLFVIIALEQFYFNINKGLENVKTCAFNSLIFVVFLILGSYIFLVKLNWGIDGYLISILFSYIACCLYLWLMGRIYKFCRLKSFDINLLKSMLKYGAPFVPCVIAWSLNVLLNRYLIIYILGSTMNGYYSVAAKVTNVVSILTAVFYQAWALSGIKEYRNNAYSTFCTNIYNAFSAIMFVFTSVLLLSVPYIGRLLFKGEFQIAWRYIPFLLLGSLFAGLSGMLQPIFLAAKKTNKLMVTTLTGIFVNLLINLLLLSKYGLQVVGFSTFISFFLVWLIRWQLAKKSVQIAINTKIFVCGLLLLCSEVIVILSNRSCSVLVASIITLLIIGLNIYSIYPMAVKLKDCIAFLKK